MARIAKKLNFDDLHAEIGKKIIDLAPAIIVALNPKENIVFFSKGAERLTGFKAREVFGKNWFTTFLPKRYLKDVRKVFNKLKAGRYPTHFETPILTKNGEEKIIYWSNTVVKKPDGKAEVIIGIGGDVTEERKVERELRESEERYKDLFENANDMIQSVDRNGKFLYVNRKWLETLGYTREEVKKLTLWDILRKDQIPHCMKVFKKVCRGEAVEHVETVFVTKDGKEIQVEGNANAHFKDGKFATTRGIFRDISKRKKMEENLKESERIMGELYETSMSLRGTTDEILTAICKKVHEIFGGFFVLVSYAKADEFYFRSGWNLPKAVIKLGKRPIKGAICSHILKNKKPLFSNNLKKDKCPKCRMPFAKDKAVKTFNLNTYFGVPLVFSDGSVRGTLCVVYKKKKEPFSERDTKILSLFARRIAIELEREKAKNSLEKIIDSLKRARIDRDEFISIVGHELKTPLTPLRGYLDLLLSEKFGPLNAKQREALEIMSKSINLSSKLITDLSQISRLESPKMKIKKEEISLDQIIEEAFKEMKSFAIEKGVFISSSIPSDFPIIHADRDSVVRVLTNLFHNAIKFTPKGGRIWINAKRTGDNVLVSIRDNGIGIAKKNLKNVFRKFTKIESKIAEEYKGTGLGLSICKAIVERHGGRIWAESKGRGKGSTFYFTFPIKEG